MTSHVFCILFRTWDLTLIFDGFLMHFGHPWSCEKNILTLYSSQKTRFRGFRNRADLPSFLASILEVFSYTFTYFLQYFFGIAFRIDFCHDFGMLLAPPRHRVWALCSPEGHQFHEKVGQRGSLNPPGVHRVACLVHRGHPGVPFGSFRGAFPWIFNDLSVPVQRFFNFLGQAECHQTESCGFGYRTFIAFSRYPNLADSGIGFLLHFPDTRILRIRESDFYCIFHSDIRFSSRFTCGFGYRTFTAFPDTWLDHVKKRF